MWKTKLKLCYDAFMEKLRLSKKTYLWALGYFLLTTLCKWRLSPDLTILLYYAGGLIGLHLLEITETMMKLEKSPFRTVFFQVILVILTFFVVSSSASRLGSGVVLFFSLRLLYLQIEAFKNQTFGLWFPVAYSQLTKTNHRYYLYFISFIFALETVLFIFL